MCSRVRLSFNQITFSTFYSSVSQERLLLQHLTLRRKNMWTKLLRYFLTQKCFTLLCIFQILTLIKGFSFVPEFFWYRTCADSPPGFSPGCMDNVTVNIGEKAVFNCQVTFHIVSNNQNMQEQVLKIKLYNIYYISKILTFFIKIKVFLSSRFVSYLQFACQFFFCVCFLFMLGSRVSVCQ